MTRHSRQAVRALAIVACALASAILLSRTAFQRRISREVTHLLGQSAPADLPVISAADLAPLPEPAQRWLRWAGVVGTRPPAIIHLRQHGRFRLGPDKPWLSFTAEEHYTTHPPAFIWPAAFTIAPFIEITGRDAYVDGHGSIDMRLFGLIPLARQHGPKLDQGALLRYLNEIVWFPAAALSRSITWNAIDQTSAQATIHHAGVTASAIFYFDELGRPIDMRAERYRTVGQGYLISTWSTPFRDYGEFAGIRVPIAGEGIWKLASGDFSYVDLRVDSVAYEPPPR